MKATQALGVAGGAAQQAPALLKSVQFCACQSDFESLLRYLALSAMVLLLLQSTSSPLRP